MAFSRPSSAPSSPSLPLRGDSLVPANLYLVNLCANDGSTINALYPFFVAGAHGLVAEYTSDFLPLLHVQPALAPRLQAPGPVTPRTLPAILAAGFPAAPMPSSSTSTASTSTYWRRLPPDHRRHPSAPLLCARRP